MKFRDLYTVQEIPYASARDFIIAHHYAKGCSQTACLSMGLVERSTGRLVGAAMWMMPAAGTVKKFVGSENPRAMMALSRLAIHPDVPTNGATFLVAGCIREIKRRRHLRTRNLLGSVPAYPLYNGLRCLITYADEMEGHTGGIYRAGGWLSEGRGQAAYRWRDEEGRLRSRFSTKNIPCAEMDRLYERVGPYAQWCYVIWLSKPAQQDFLQKFTHPRHMPSLVVPTHPIQRKLK
tara:strand:+ start:421 stop:1125 length:705 start_codon:yes stop_codon:yes gene_type:complete